MMYGSRRTILDVAEDLAEPPKRDLATRWLGGGVAVIVFGAYAVQCIVTQRAMFLRGRPLQLIEWTDTSAVLLGTVYLSIAAFAHFHWFWSARTGGTSWDK
jgi:hypothetical protein